MKRELCNYLRGGVLMLLFLFGSINLFAQNLTVSGIITDDTGFEVIGATVIVEGDASHGVVSDLDGKYTLTNVPSNASLQISYVGMKTQIIPVNGRTEINVVLHADTELLDEIVVVGFGTQKKVNLTGSVATVSSKDIAARPINSVTEALQGMVPGMNVFAGNNGGQLNSTQKFNIRGQGTIGTGSSVSPLVLIDGMAGDMSVLNPQDIESISVLKDASASSIYGSRAAGGVILITTKRGKEGKTVVNYNNSFRITSPLNMPKMANSYNFALYFNDAGHEMRYNEEKLKALKQVVEGTYSGPTMFANTNKGIWEVWDDTTLFPIGNTDWMKEQFGTGFAQEHNVSVSGGTEKFQYYFSGNYLGQRGMLRHADDKRNRYELSGSITTQLAKWFKLGYTSRFNRVDYSQPTAMDGLFYHNMFRYWANIPLTDPNGHYTQPSNVDNLQRGGRTKNQTDQNTHQLTAIIEPVKNWLINVEMNYRTTNYLQHREWLTVELYDINNNPYPFFNQTSSIREYVSKDDYFNPNIYTSYEHSFGDHWLKGMVGFQSELLKTRNFSAQQNGVIANIPTLNTTSEKPVVGGVFNEWSTAGFFGRLNYDYKGRYLAEANLRYDGSSRFLREKRWNWFPSFSLGWNIAREEFFEPIHDKINTLKFRFSYGRLGNQNTDNWYPFFPTMGYSVNAGNWLINGQKPTISSQPALVSALLTWEKTQTWNVGFDVGALNNRLTGTLDYFERKTYDMVGPAPELPDVLGTAVPRVNNLDMTSRGWELSVTWRDQIKDFNYGATLNLSDNRVRIDKYPNDAKDIGQTYYVGAYLGDIWGYETIGIAKTDQEMAEHLAKVNQNSLGSNWGAGDIMYRDLNGDGFVNRGENTVDNPGDRRIIGNSTPRYSFGLNTNASWKGFDLKVYFQGVLKRDFWMGGNVFWGASGGLWQASCFEPHLDYFRADSNHPLGQNLDAYYPQPDWRTGKNQNQQTRYLQNAAYCRLKNVTLGYTLPQDFSRNFYVQSLRLFFSAENLFTITKFTKMADPEMVDAGGWATGKMYPLSRTMSFGVSVTL